MGICFLCIWTHKVVSCINSMLKCTWTFTANWYYFVWCSVFHLESDNYFSSMACLLLEVFLKVTARLEGIFDLHLTLNTMAVIPFPPFGPMHWYKLVFHIYFILLDILFDTLHTAISLYTSFCSQTKHG